MNTKLLFHYVSYLQYPLLIVGCYFALKPSIYGTDFDLSDINSMLVFMGLSVSFSTLQDTQKTQNNFSKNIWESPVRGKVVLSIFSLTTFFIIVFGLYHYLSISDSALKEVSFGMLVFGIGQIGMLKSAGEMFENHRKDKNPVVSAHE